MSCDPDFLDSGSPPKFFRRCEFENDFRQSMYEYRKRVNFKFNQHDGTVCYAVTLTLDNKEVNYLKDAKIAQLEYLKTKLIDLKIPGVWIAEDTKKKIKHLHGILYCKGHIDLERFYNKWLASNKFVKIKDDKNYMKWMNYMCKTLITPDILQWISKTNQSLSEFSVTF